MLTHHSNQLLTNSLTHSFVCMLVFVFVFVMYFVFLGRASSTYLLVFVFVFVTYFVFLGRASATSHCPILADAPRDANATISLSLLQLKRKLLNKLKCKIEFGRCEIDPYSFGAAK